MKSILKKAPPSKPFQRVVVTGLGCVTPIGNNVETFWKNLIEKKSGIKKLNYDQLKFVGNVKFDPNQIPSKVAGIIEDFKIENYTKLQNRMSKNIQYAFASSFEALKDANWVPKTEEEKRYTGVAIGSSIGGVEEICTTNEQILNSEYKKISPFSVPKMLVNLAAGWISLEYGLKGPNHSVATACASGGHSIGDAFRLIKYGDAKVMVCGSTDSALHPTPVSGFCRMNALSTKYNETPEIASRPFDKDRDGFVIGEGAGILVLEELEHALNRGANIYAEIRGYGLGGDAYHITSPNPDGSGAISVMERALKESGIEPQYVDYVNAHATSTPTGDKIELNAIKKLFGDQCKNLKVSSIKGSIGHLLGAAGSVEAIATILSLKNDIIPPNLNFQSTDPDLKDCEEMIVTETLKKTNWVSLSNSFGFGGTNTSLCFTKFEK